MIDWLRRATAAQPAASASGAQAEKLAEAYLQRHGLTLRTRNFGCKHGELDLIMDDDQTLVFVEVRYRKSSRYGSAAETVTHAKQRKLIAAAQAYLLHNPRLASRPLRFDVVGIMPTSSGDFAYTWLKDAFAGI